MNRTSTLYLVIALLIILNIVALGFMYVTQERPRKPMHQNRHEQHLIEKFGFDDKQLESFRHSKEEHMKKSKLLHSRLKDLSVSYYSFEDPVHKDSLFADIMATTEEIYKVNSLHFNDISNIAGKEKEEQVKEFINALLKNFEHDRPGRKQKK